MRCLNCQTWMVAHARHCHICGCAAGFQPNQPVSAAQENFYRKMDGPAGCAGMLTWLFQVCVLVVILIFCATFLHC